MKRSVYEIITERIIEKLEQGTIPWEKPWQGGIEGRPKNYMNKKEYQGINIWLLQMQLQSTPYWLTYKQAEAMQGHIKKGEKGIPIIFWKTDKIEVEDKKTGKLKEEQRWLLRYYTVFNLDQTEGIDYQKPDYIKRQIPEIKECENLLQSFNHVPPIKYTGTQPFYSPQPDIITMPQKDRFNTTEGFYNTLYHEIIHSTGHKSRLNRLNHHTVFGSTEYSKEELIAEMGATFLCSHTGIEKKTIENHAAYIKGWLSRLRNDKKMVIIAAAQAQKACDYLLKKTT